MSAASAHAYTHTHTCTPRTAVPGPIPAREHHCPHLVAAPEFAAHRHMRTYYVLCMLAHLLAVQCCIAAMQCDADMQVLKIGPLSLFEHDPGPRAKHCFYRPHGPTSNCHAPAVPSLRRQLAADRRWRWSLGPHVWVSSLPNSIRVAWSTVV